MPGPVGDRRPAFRRAHILPAARTRSATPPPAGRAGRGAPPEPGRGSRPTPNTIPSPGGGPFPPPPARPSLRGGGGGATPAPHDKDRAAGARGEPNRHTHRARLAETSP